MPTGNQSDQTLMMSESEYASRCRHLAASLLECHPNKVALVSMHGIPKREVVGLRLWIALKSNPIFSDAPSFLKECKKNIAHLLLLQISLKIFGVSYLRLQKKFHLGRLLPH